MPVAEPAIAAIPAPEPPRVHTLPSPPMAPAAEPERRRGWGLFRARHRQEPERAEPQMGAGRGESRASVEVMPRNPAPQQRASNAAQTNADDLFPDFKKEDQFEIPAFLRRQTN
jgi:cell division protein FtsZ